MLARLLPFFAEAEAPTPPPAARQTFAMVAGNFAGIEFGYGVAQFGGYGSLDPTFFGIDGAFYTIRGIRTGSNLPQIIRVQFEGTAQARAFAQAGYTIDFGQGTVTNQATFINDDASGAVRYPIGSGSVYVSGQAYTVRIL